eukprot:SAG31_NODE_16749_length_697_cov_1.598662_2_plen_65_part_00
MKIVEEDYMLGVKRTMKTDSDGVQCIELTQTDYIVTLSSDIVAAKKEGEKVDKYRDHVEQCKVM